MTYREMTLEDKVASLTNRVEALERQAPPDIRDERDRCANIVSSWLRGCLAELQNKKFEAFNGLSVLDMLEKIEKEIREPKNDK